VTCTLSYFLSDVIPVNTYFLPRFVQAIIYIFEMFCTQCIYSPDVVRIVVYFSSFVHLALHFFTKCLKNDCLFIYLMYTCFTSAAWVSQMSLLLLFTGCCCFYSSGVVHILVSRRVQLRHIEEGQRAESKHRWARFYGSPICRQGMN